MARNFDGSADYAKIDSSPLTDPPHTISIWIRGDNTQSSTPSELIVQSGSHQCRLDYHSSNIQIFCWNGSASSAITTVGSSNNVWVLGTIGQSSESHREAWVNGGNSVQNTTTRALNAFDRVVIGAHFTGSASRLHNGDLCEYALWSVLLTDNEIAALGRGANPHVVRGDKLEIYAPLWGHDSPEPSGRYSGTANFTLTSAPPRTTTKPVRPPVEPIENF